MLRPLARTERNHGRTGVAEAVARLAERDEDERDGCGQHPDTDVIARRGARHMGRGEPRHDRRRDLREADRDDAEDDGGNQPGTELRRDLRATTRAEGLGDQHLHTAQEPDGEAHEREGHDAADAHAGERSGAEPTDEEGVGQRHRAEGQEGDHDGPGEPHKLAGGLGLPGQIDRGM